MEDAFVRKQNRIYNDRVAIGALPYEVLAYIFDLATRMEMSYLDNNELTPVQVILPVQPKRPNKTRSRETTGVDSKDSPLGPTKHFLLDVPTAVSHVCAWWRKCALSTPGLWTYIKMSGSPPHERAEEWLLRSKKAPLRIKIDLIDHDYVEPREDEEFNEETGYPEQYWTDEHVWEALEVVLPHIGRWKEVYFYGEYLDLVVYFIAELERELERKRAPLLTRILLEDANQDYGRTKQASWLYSSGNPLFKRKGAVPNLVSLNLIRFSLGWGKHACGRQGLTTLELAHLTGVQQPTIHQFVGMLQASPNLEELVLRNSGPSAWRARVSLVDGGSLWRSVVGVPVSLLRLKFLSLAEFNRPTYVKNLVELISCPNLEKLHLDSLDMGTEEKDYREVIWALSSMSARQDDENIGPSCGLAPRYPKLKELSISEVKSSCTMAYSCLLHLSSQLKRLHISNSSRRQIRGTLSCFYFQGARRSIIGRSVRPNETEELDWLDDTYGPPCPQLEEFSCIGPGWTVDKLVVFAKIRKNARKPLRKLKLFKDNDFKQSDIRRLSKVVSEAVLY